MRRILPILLLAVATTRAETRSMDVATYREKVHAAWLGQIVGAIFGWPFEGKPRNVARLEHYLRGYDFAPVDDDYYYEMVALYGFEKHGLSMSVEQLGEMWKQHQAGSWGSSEQALLALEKGIRAPETGSPRYNRWFYTIGPQFSADLYGMLAPGMVNLAAHMARTYSHVNGYAEGSDGAVFIAACVSEAFFEKSTEKIVRQAAQMIAPGSNYRKALDQVLDGFAMGRKPVNLAAETEARWRPEYPQMNNAVANGALVAIALLYGEGNYLDSINLVTQLGDNTDADCNAANVGAILGAMNGLRAIPKQFIEPLRNRIYGESMGPVKFAKPVDEKISDLAERIATLGERNIIGNGGARKGENLAIKREKPQILPLERFEMNDFGPLWNRSWVLSGAGRGTAGTTWVDGGILVTYPHDSRPVRLESEVLLSSRRPAMTLQVDAESGKPWRLEVYAGNDRVLSQTIEGPAELRIDLAKYAGTRVLLRAYQYQIDGQPIAVARWRSIAIE